MNYNERRVLDETYDTYVRRALAVVMYVGGPLAYGLMAYILSHAL